MHIPPGGINFSTADVYSGDKRIFVHPFSVCCCWKAVVGSQHPLPRIRLRFNGPCSLVRHCQFIFLRTFRADPSDKETSTSDKYSCFKYWPFPATSNPEGVSLVLSLPACLRRAILDALPLPKKSRYTNAGLLGESGRLLPLGEVGITTNSSETPIVFTSDEQITTSPSCCCRPVKCVYRTAAADTWETAADHWPKPA